VQLQENACALPVSINATPEYVKRGTARAKRGAFLKPLSGIMAAVWVNALKVVNNINIVVKAIVGKE
jgi:hypothetical protein